MPLTRQQIQQRARKLKLLLLDVDGVMTDGRIYYVPRPEGGMFETKTFHSRDGIGIRYAREAGINHETHAVNRDARLRNVRGDHDLRLLITGDGGVLILGLQFAVERQDDIALRLGGVTDGFDGLGNLKAAGHEHQHVAPAA